MALLIGASLEMGAPLVRRSSLEGYEEQRDGPLVRRYREFNMASVQEAVYY